MYSLLVKHGQLLAFGLGILISLIFLMSVFGGMSEFETLTKETQGTTNIFNFGLWAVMILALLSFAAILVFGLVQTATNPKGATKFLIGIAGIVVIYFIFSSMTDASPTGRLAHVIGKFDIDGGVSKFISGAIGTGLSLACIAAAVFLLSEERNLFK